MNNYYVGINYCSYGFASYNNYILYDNNSSLVDRRYITGEEITIVFETNSR